MIALQMREGGICLPVKVQPGARRNAIVGAHAGALKVAVNAAPEQGKANAAVIELLAEQLQLPRSKLCANLRCNQSSEAVCGFGCHR